MEIWLKQGKKKLRLPILPQEVGASSEQDNKTETVNALGEVNLLGLPKLQTVTLESHFPRWGMNYDQYSGYPTPKKCVKLIEKMKKKGVIRFIVTPIINYEATIEGFEWKYQDGTKDIYYTLQIKQYRRTAKKRNTKKAKKKRTLVKQGDTWAKLAKKHTGSSKKAKKIAKMNNMKNRKKPPVGERIVIDV